MPRLVHHLGRAVELGFHPRSGVDDLRRRQQRALLAVHEVRQQPPELLAAQRSHLGRSELLPDVRAVDGDLHVGQVLGLGVDAEVPGKLLAGVPLVALGLLVEVVQLAPHHLVVPAVRGVELRGEELDLALALVVGLGVGHGAVIHGSILLRVPAGSGRAA